jgi:pyridoxal phosphate-dependent aminotransferase EpsN
MSERIYLSPPEILGDERERLMAAVDSGWLAPVGPDLDAFEEALAAVGGVDHAVALSSGTAALHLALHANGIGPGDDVLVSSFTFVASANAVLYTGATPVFVDSEESTWCIDPQLVLDELRRRRSIGRLPRAVVVTDLYGHCADYGGFVEQCRELGVLVVEDAAEAIGSSAGGRPAGSLADIAVFSFNGNKIVTTTGGGALLCDDATTAARIRYLATQARQPVAHYEHTEIGFNYRLSNLLAAFGAAQLATLGERISRRLAVRQWYEHQFAPFAGIALNPQAPWCRSNNWLTSITVDPTVAGFSSTDVLDAFAAANIEARPVWKPLHLQPQFAGADVVGGRISASIFERGVTLPSGGGQSGFHERIAAVIDSLHQLSAGSSSAR